MRARHTPRIRHRSYAGEQPWSGSVWKWKDANLNARKRIRKSEMVLLKRILGGQNNREIQQGLFIAVVASIYSRIVYSIGVASRSLDRNIWQYGDLGLFPVFLFWDHRFRTFKLDSWSYTKRGTFYPYTKRLTFRKWSTMRAQNGQKFLLAIEELLCPCLLFSFSEFWFCSVEYSA